MRPSQMNGSGKPQIVEVKVQGIEKRKDNANKNVVSTRLLKDRILNGMNALYPVIQTVLTQLKLFN
jgi:hypothetical protein